MLLKPAVFFRFFGILFLGSCSITQNIALNPDGSGSVRSSVHLEDFYRMTLEDLTDLGGPGEENKLAPENMARELSLNPFFSDVKVLSSGPGDYEGHLNFKDIQELFAITGQHDQTPVVTYESSDETRTLSLRINHENFQNLFSLFPALKDPGFQYFLPEKDLSPREYKEALVFIFEDRAGEGALKKQIEKAVLDLTIHVKGDILKHQGGTLVNKRCIRFVLPLLTLLLHKEEIYYFLTYKDNPGE